MEQVAIITKLVQDMIAMNSTEKEMGNFLLNLNCAVRNLTSIVEDIPRDRQWAEEWGAIAQQRAEREKAEEKAKWERDREWEREERNRRRRELYQEKKVKKEQK
jgi:hypothetical protein